MSIKLPFLKSIPLDDCAFNTLCDSTNNDGTNLKAIAIIILTSETGNFNILKGLKISSRAYVSSIEEVVVVKIVAASIIKNTFKDTYNASWIAYGLSVYQLVWYKTTLFNTFISLTPDNTIAL